MCLSNDQENDSAFKANMVLAVRERWGRCGAWMGPCRCPALLQSSLVMWIEGGVLLVNVALGTASHKHPSRIVFEKELQHTPHM